MSKELLNTPIIELKNIKVVFKAFAQGGGLFTLIWLLLLPDVSLHLMPGKTIGLVRGIRYGKSTTANVSLWFCRWLPEGTVLFKGSRYVTKRNR